MVSGFAIVYKVLKMDSHMFKFIQTLCGFPAKLRTQFKYADLKGWSYLEI